jgi:hypothetical protein
VEDVLFLDHNRVIDAIARRRFTKMDSSLIDFEGTRVVRGPIIGQQGGVSILGGRLHGQLLVVAATAAESIEAQRRHDRREPKAKSDSIDEQRTAIWRGRVVQGGKVG